MDYDVIGDVHGNADALEALLLRMGYTDRAGAWSPPPNRTAIFVGDLIDRGSRQVDSVRIARGMVDGGHAHVLLGNHELNAMAWLNGWRADTPKNRKQHAEFLSQVGEASREHREMVEWFQTLDLWLNLPELRAVHACWHPRAIEVAADILGGAKLEFSLLERATTGTSNTYQADGAEPSGDPLFWAVQTLTKGIEVELPEGLFFKDKEGHERHDVRLKWWLNSPTLDEAAFLPEGYRDQRLRRSLPPGIVPGYDNSKPVFFGHYWRTGLPELLTPHVACVDYSAGRGGPLVAYQWRGEDGLCAANFVSSAD